MNIPYEITKYLDNATYKYTDMDYHSIELNINDKIIVSNFGRIPRKWNVSISKIKDYNSIYITTSTGIYKEFNIQKDSYQDIKEWYSLVKSEQKE